MLGLDIDNDALQRMADTVAATEEQFLKARASTLRKIRQPVRRAVLREVAKERKVPQRSLESRVYMSDVGAEQDSVRLWFGTWDVSLFEIGSPRQTKTGVTVGRHRYPGAFKAKIYSADEQVWIRLHSRHYSPELYPTRYRPGDRGLGSSRGRFPVVRAAIQIDGIVERVLERSGDTFKKRFMDIFSQELNYFVNVKWGA